MIKMTFGLQPHHIERIEQECARFNISSSDLDSPGLQKGWVLYDDYFWIKLGKEFGWTPLNLALCYHEYLNNLKHEMLSDCTRFLEGIDVPDDLVETKGNLVMNSLNILETK